ncbi:MAG: hypothetical protein ABFC28_01120 [Rikenellaceae bacterium]
MKKKTAFIGILGLIIFSAASIVKQFSPTSISDFFYGFFSGIALVFIVTFIVLLAWNLCSSLKKKVRPKSDKEL